jgi:hypothetical protein
LSGLCLRTTDAINNNDNNNNNNLLVKFLHCTGFEVVGSLSCCCCRITNEW